MKEYDVFHALAVESEAATPNRIMRQAEGAARIPAVDVEELWPRARWAQ